MNIQLLSLALIAYSVAVYWVGDIIEYKLHLSNLRDEYAKSRLTPAKSNV